MNSDRLGGWYSVAFLLAVGAHAALLAAFPGRHPAAVQMTPAVEVELVDSTPLEALPSEPPPVQPNPPVLPEPPTMVPEVPADPEPVPEPPPVEPVVPQALASLKTEPPPVPAKPRPAAPSRKAAPPVSAERSSPGSPGALGGVVRQARPDTAHNPPPRYPEMARRNGWEGVVIVRAHVASTGRVLSVALQRGSRYGVLDQAALAAVKNWRFRPGTRGGTTTDSVVEVPVNFSLRR